MEAAERFSLAWRSDERYCGHSPASPEQHAVVGTVLTLPLPVEVASEEQPSSAWATVARQSWLAGTPVEEYATLPLVAASLSLPAESTPHGQPPMPWQ